MAYPYEPPVQNRILSFSIADFGAAAVSLCFCPGFDGRIKRINATVNAAATGADTILTIKIGATTVTGSGITIPLAGAAIGNVASSIPTGLNVFKATDFIRVDSDGGATNTSLPGSMCFELEPV